jgi:hypothetical protein
MYFYTVLYEISGSISAQVPMAKDAVAPLTPSPPPTYDGVSIIFVTGAVICTTVVLHGNVRRLRPELWWQRNWLLHHYNAASHTSFLTRESLTKNNITVNPSHLTFICYPDWRWNWKAAILTQWRKSRQNCGGGEHRHRKRLPGCTKKNGRSAGNGAFARKGLLRRWWWPVGPKSVFDQRPAPVLEIMDGSLYNCV